MKALENVDLEEWSKGCFGKNYRKVGRCGCGEGAIFYKNYSSEENETHLVWVCQNCRNETKVKGS